MTGTGTQADPYIPTTLTEFITAVGTTGAYVALTQDINAADDPEYSGELTTPITWAAASVHGGGFTIAGVTLRTAASAISIAKGVPVDALRLDIGFKREGVASPIVAYGSGSKPTFRGCVFRMKFDEGSYRGSFAEEIDFTDCAMSISTTADTAGGSDYFWQCSFLRTTVHFPNNVDRYSSGAGAIIGQSTSFTRSAMIFDDLTDGANLVGGGAGSMSYSYIAVKSSTQSLRISKGASGCIIALDSSAGATSVPSGWTLATIDQMKDQDWLTSVGFLP